MTVAVNVNLTKKQAGALYMKSLKQEERIKTLEGALSEIAGLFEDGKEEYYAVGNIINNALHPEDSSV